jgi:MFS family permease
MTQSMASEDAQRAHRRVIAAGVAGNVMEWYDFAVYGYFVRTIGQLYFPADDPSLSLMAAYGAFAVGFFMRPLGAVVFGYIGDRVGRAYSLLLSVVAMAVPTFAIGLLPTYHDIGIGASILMLLCRILQGLAVGGEYTGSVVFLAERAPPSAAWPAPGHPSARWRESSWAPSWGPPSSTPCPWPMWSAGPGACPSFSGWWSVWSASSSAGMSPSTRRRRARASP